MIHTAQFYCIISQQEVIEISNKFKCSIDFIADEVDLLFTACKTSVIKKFNQWILFVNVDFIKMLHRADINEQDIIKIEQYLTRYINYIHNAKDYESLVLIRLDYRFDVKIKDKTHREILFKLYKKTLEHYRHKNKYDQFDTTIYFNTKSTQTVVYDKEKEREKSGFKTEDYELDIIRFEFRVMNKHLNNKKHKKKIEKSLNNYFKKNLYLKYMKENFEPLLYKGDYYAIFRSEVIIKNSSLKVVDKQLIRDFLVDVSFKGLSGVKNMLDKKGALKYSKYRYKKCIQLLERLEINPISIPKHIKGVSFIENPFKMEGPMC